MGKKNKLDASLKELFSKSKTIQPSETGGMVETGLAGPEAGGRALLSGCHSSEEELARISPPQETQAIETPDRDRSAKAPRLLLTR